MGKVFARRFGRKKWATSVACLSVLAALVVSAAPAGAAATTNQQAVAVASSQLSLGGFLVPGPVVLPVPLPIVLTDLSFTANATWSGALTTNVGWDSDNVRQGASLDVTRSVPLTSGTIDVTWQVAGKADGVSFGPSNVSSSSVTCAPALSGGVSCAGDSDQITLPGAIPSLIPDFSLIEAKLGVHVAFDVTPQGAVVNRTFSVGGATVPAPTANPGPLGLETAPNTETLAMPCTSKAGDAVNYNLSNYDWAPATTATQQTRVSIVNTGPFGADAGTFEIKHVDVGPAAMTNPAFDLTGSGFLTSMGPLLANNVSPTIAPFGTFTGVEGTPVQFSATTTSQCPIDSYVWNFSDGTTSFGPTPQRTFHDGGTYNGQLVVTDETGLSATRTFTVDIANVMPSVNAGPDTTADWGRLVAFNGQATAPGSDDQATLQYTWSFGDGTPSATGGPSVVHAYATPNTYQATLTVCDEDGLCNNDTRDVIVTKRDTTASYLGDYSGTFDTPGSVNASLVDEYGQAVNGRPITFQIGTDGPLTASTNSSGIATKAYTPTLAAGSSYTASASFDGTLDALYNSSNVSTNPFVVSKKATTTTYTGATTGGPNKTVVLSAVLKDATGKPLAGKTITFQLGTQGPFVATTNTSGIATYSLKLTQKNGTYTVSATYAGDASFYTGSSQGMTFKLQAK